MDEIARKAPSHPWIRGCGNILVVVAIILILGGIALGPIGHPRGWLLQSATMQQAHQLGALLFMYSNDNEGVYPSGSSSAEIFQKLLDGGYANSPEVFYFPMPGKVKPVEGKKLKPENVCFDVTVGVNQKDSEFLPVVFTTGYRVDYNPGGAAQPLHPSGPFFMAISEAWPLSLLGIETQKPMGGIAVYYLGNRAMWLNSTGTATMEGKPYSLEHFVPGDFDAKGKTYRQLTPDGGLPPR